MRLHVSLFAGLFVFAIGLSTAQAAIIVNDNMEYATQAAFESNWVPIGSVAPLSAELSTEQASSPTKSAKVAGEATVSGKQRNRDTFPDTPVLTVGSQLVWSFDFYDSNAGAAPYRQSSNLQDTTAPGGTNQLVSLGLNNNQGTSASGGNYYMARVLGYSNPIVDPDGGPNEALAATNYVKLNDFGVGLRSTGWHNLKAVLSTNDGLSTDYAFYVDNVLAELISNVGTAAQFRQYDNVALGSGVTNAGNAAYYDNFYLEFIPPNVGPTVVDYVELVPQHASDDSPYSHQMTAIDPDVPPQTLTWSGVSLASYVPGCLGCGPGAATNPTIGAGGLFSWNMVGSSRGIYTWNVGVSDGIASDNGTIRININAVPEPSSAALCGLLIGLVGLIRRRVR